MADSRSSWPQALALMGQRAAYDTVRLLAQRVDGAPFQYVWDRTRCRPDMLKALAAHGFVRRAGTWDIPLQPSTVVALTALGHKLGEQLEQLHQWAQQRVDERPQAAGSADHKRCPHC